MKGNFIKLFTVLPDDMVSVMDYDIEGTSNERKLTGNQFVALQKLQPGILFMEKWKE